MLPAVVVAPRAAAEREEMGTLTVESTALQEDSCKEDRGGIMMALKGAAAGRPGSEEQPWTTTVCTHAFHHTGRL